MMTIKHPAVLLYSGGMDSFIAYWYIRKELGINPHLLYLHLKHKYAGAELKAIQDSLEYLPDDVTLSIDTTTLSLGKWEEPSAYIPLRNSFLAHVGSFYSDNIFLITQKGETMLGDRSLRGFRLMSETLTHLYDDGRTVNVDSPFWSMTKVDMVRWYKEAGLSIDDLKETHSCYAPVLNEKEPYIKPLACGKCSACVRRWIAMSLNDITEQYSVNPWETALAAEYIEKGKQGFYGWGRDKEILEAFRKVGRLDEANNPSK